MTTATLPETVNGLQVREVQIRAVDADRREIEGIAVPYGETLDIYGYRERFEAGAFDDDADEVLLFSAHDHRSGGLPIGRVVEARSTDDGYLVRARISETPKGDEVYRLAKDKVLTRFSIGFEPIDRRIEDEDVVVHTRARLKEVSVVPFPAYDRAAITEVRSEINDQHEEDVVETTEIDVADLRDTVTELERRIAVLSERDDNDGGGGSQFRSAGELLQALARNDDAARAEFRDFGTTVEANVVRPGWMERPLRFMTEKRRLINIFNRAPLPPTGNTVEYPVVDSASGTVERQVTEGAALAYMEVALGTETATVGTYGGFSSLSRQAIERSDLAYLDAVLRYQAIQYAKATALVIRNEMVGLASGNTFTVAGDSAASWIGAVIDAQGAIEDTSLGLDAEVILVGRDVYRRIATIMDANDRPVFALRGDGQNTIGAANVVRATFDIAGVPGYMDPSLPANFARVVSSDAITVLESPGAPFRLQDESVINLTKDFSLYGYLAATINDLNGVVALDVDNV